MQLLRLAPFRRLCQVCAVATLLLGAMPARAQAPTLWGEVALPGGVAAARETMNLGDENGRLGSTLLIDLVRRYANTDLRVAGIRFEQHLRAAQTAGSAGMEGSPEVAVLPLPLPAFWEAEFAGHAVPLIVSMVRSRPALLTYHGLMALDASTLSELSSRPTLLRGLLASDVSSAAFAAFSQSLHIGTSGVLTPGGEADAAVWQELVGHTPADVDAFVRTLFTQDNGRLAWFYDTVGALPDATRRFVLAAHLADGERLAAVQAIYRRFISADTGWRIETRPFHRPVFDGALALLVLAVGDDGELGPAWWPALFDDVTRQADWAARRPETTAVVPDRPADVRWLFDWVFAVPDEASVRFGALRFAQRLFASTPRDAAPHIHAALGAAIEMPLLMFSVERMGVRDPETLAAIARAGRAATHAGNQSRVLPALARWQAALGLLEQVQRRATLPADRVAALVQSLATIAPNDPESATGTVAAWLHDHLVPQLVANPAAFATLEEAFLHAATTPRRAARQPFTWEGLPYVVDEPAAALRSATAIRQSRAGPRLQDVIELHQIRRAIIDGASLPQDEARQLVVRLERLAPIVASIDHEDDRRVRGYERVIDALGGSTGERRAQHLPAISAALDAMTEAVVPSLLYALAVSPTSEPILYPEAWTRHGLQQPSALPVAAGRPWRQVAWQFPTDYGFGGGTRLIGAYLAVDVAMSGSQLVRVTSADLPVPGVVDDPMRRGLVESLVLTDANEAPAVPASTVPALAAGRKVVDDWMTTPPSADQVRATLLAASVDPWRANALAWDVARGRSEALRSLTMSERLWLGSAADAWSDAAPHWSGSSRLVDGCLCLTAARRITHEQTRGRRLGVQALRPHEITLRLAELLSSLDLDVGLVPAILPMAIQDWLDRSRPAWSDDWEAFTSWPHALSTERVEEYLLHLVSVGVFSPPATEESPR